MKFIPPITNSSNFYAVTAYRPSAEPMPINELAWVACRLFGARHAVAKAYSDLRVFYSDVREKATPSPRLISSFPGFSASPPPETSITYLDEGYLVPVNALPFLSGFAWSDGDSIAGVDTKGEEWEVCLDAVAVSIAPETWCTGTAVLLVLSDHRRYNWYSFAQKLAEAIPAPPNLKEAVRLLQHERFSTTYLILGNILLIDYSCFWKSADGTVWGVSPTERQGTEAEDAQRICYAANLLLQPRCRFISWSDIGG